MLFLIFLFSQTLKELEIWYLTIPFCQILFGLTNQFWRLCLKSFSKLVVEFELVPQTFVWGGIVVVGTKADTLRMKMDANVTDANFIPHSGTVAQWHFWRGKGTLWVWIRWHTNTNRCPPEDSFYILKCYQLGDLQRCKLIWSGVSKCLADVIKSKF